MKELKNREELVKMIEFYKTGKITVGSLETELGKAFSEALEPSIIKVSVISEVDGSTNSTFGVTSLPEKTGEKLSLSILVDKDALMNMITPKDVVAAIEGELKDYQKILKEYNKFIVDNKDKEVTLGDAIKLFIELYKGSIKRLAESIPSVFAELREKRQIQSLESLTSEVIAIEKGSDDMRFIIERLTVSKKFPMSFLIAARELAKSLKKVTDAEAQKIPLFTNDDEKPVMNQFYQQRRALSDGTYTDNKMSKVIAHDYKPSTNQ
jgi:hypothetical protein